MQEGSFLDPASVLLAAKLHEGQVVVDFSGGGGFFARAAARLTDGPVWVVDASSDLLSRVKSLALAEGLQNIEVMRGNIESTEGSNLPKEHADIVLAANILFTAEHKDAVIKEIYRVLKRSGRAVVVDWTDSHGGLGPASEHVVTEPEAKNLFVQNGFDIEGALDAGAYHWGFVVRKKARMSAQ